MSKTVVFEMGSRDHRRVRNVNSRDPQTLEEYLENFYYLISDKTTKSYLELTYNAWVEQLLVSLGKSYVTGPFCLVRCSLYVRQVRLKS